MEASSRGGRNRAASNRKPQHVRLGVSRPRRSCRRGAPCPFRFVAYGAGNAFEASVTYIADLDPVPSRVRYFGDLDTEGTAIPTRASARAVAAELPAVEPHHDALPAASRPRYATASRGAHSRHRVVWGTPVRCRRPLLLRFSPRPGMGEHRRPVQRRLVARSLGRVLAVPPGPS